MAGTLEGWVNRANYQFGRALRNHLEHE